MRIFWMTNVILPQIAQAIGRQEAYYIGWLTSLLDRFLEQDDTEIAVCYPDHGDRLIHGRTGKLTYYGLPAWCSAENEYQEAVTDYLKTILEEYKPDILQVFGTEYPHSLSVIKAFHRPERTLVHIQGLITEYAKEYRAGLPDKVCHAYTLRDFLRQDNIAAHQKKFAARGPAEIEAIQLSGHILGRTHWDKECTIRMNPEAEYHHVNEGLRDSFYDAVWDLHKCERNSLFVSQGTYPIKGLHILLEAMPAIRRQFPDVKLAVAGVNRVYGKTFQERLKETYYNRYLKKLIAMHHLEDAVTFMGPLGEEQMLQQYLHTHVFVCPSSIENSPNSVGEAMLTGMPVVSSDVGGVASMLENHREGLLYTPYTDAGLLAERVRTIFSDDELAVRLGRAARERALQTHDRQAIYEKLSAIYRKLCE